MKSGEKLEVMQMSTEEVIPYANNPRHNDDAVDAVAASIREFGFQQPIVVDKDHVIIVGHTRLKAAKKLGLETVPVVVADLSEDKANAYRLADNKTGELATWDFDLLNIELDHIEMNMAEFGFPEIVAEDITKDLDDNRYTTETSLPQYEPNGDVVFLEELCDDSKARELLEEIENADISEAEKGFLKMAAARHYRFNYKKIAEYYISASEDMQKLMERSALVLIDFDDAIKNGYVKLSKRLSELLEVDRNA